MDWKGKVDKTPSTRRAVGEMLVEHEHLPRN